MEQQLIFVIPFNREDLLNSSNSNQFVVSRVLDPKEIVSELSECHEYLEDGATFILEHFEVFYSVLCEFSRLDESTKKDAIFLALGGTKALTAQLALFLDNGNIDRDLQPDMLNSLKMLCYILCQLITSFESQLSKPADEGLLVMKKGNKKTRPKKQVDESDESPSWDWENFRAKAMGALQELSQLPLHILWDPPVIEENFVSCLCNCCYKVLENPLIQRSKDIRYDIFRLLGRMVSKYSHGYAFGLKVVQLLQHFEFLVGPLAQGVYLIISEFGAKYIIGDIIREMSRIQLKEGAGDTASTRAFAAFLEEIAALDPMSMHASMSLLVDYLEDESYVMRNCVLSIMGDIVLKIFGDESHSGGNTTQQRDNLLDHLVEHLHDCNAFVRSKTLQTWQKICEEKVCPLSFQHKVLKMVVGRLQDKSCIVRKNAIQLVTVLLRSNPFGAKLSFDDLKENYEKENQKLIEMDTAAFPQESPLDDNNCSRSEQDAIENLDTTISEALSDPALDAIPTDVAKQKVLVQYLKDCMAFAELLAQAIPLIAQLLCSGHTSDVLEAIHFFVAAFEFGVHDAIVGVRKMLSLAWSQEPAVRDSVVAAYKQIYLNGSGKSRMNAQHVADKLTVLLLSASLGECISLEELICHLVRSGELGSGIVAELWERFVNKDEIHALEHRIAAIKLLGMMAGAKPDIIEDNLHLIINVGFGPQADKDFVFAHATCVALSMLGGSGKPSVESKEPPFRLSSHHQVFSALAEVVLRGFSVTDDDRWIPFAFQAISTCYKLAEHPDILCGDMLKSLVKNEFGQDGILTTIEQYKLSRIIAFACQIASHQLTHLDTHIFSELKRRNFLKEESENMKKKMMKNKTKKRVSLSASRRRTMGNILDDSIDNCEEEMGLTGAVADDVEADFIQNVCDTECVTGGNLLALLSPIISSICINPSLYSGSSLYITATLALAKFMLVSSEFCEANMQLLFTILEKSANPVICTNLIIAIGDLAVRFPNLVEPWISHIYARLHDESPIVRRSTLTILTHLILNSMVKVKGQISDVAKCIVDDDQCISSMARTLFKKLSTRENEIYNILPDIISRLSDPTVGVGEEEFRNILRFIMSLISKERQVECMVEKICQRFTTANTDRQCRDLAFCLSLFTFNEKCLRKLQDNFSCYGDKLVEPDVYSLFTAILSAVNKAVKPESKILVEELEKKFEETHLKGVDEENVDNRIGHIKMASTRKSKIVSSKKPKQKDRSAVKNKPVMQNADSDEDFSSNTLSATRSNIPRTSNRKRTTRRRFVFSDDSDEEISGSQKLQDDAKTRDENVSPKFRNPENVRETRSRQVHKRTLHRDEE